ncbi:MAG TPA: hypothetical protein VFO28_04015, partial [Burkholderiaceae bacterium]|nr:hypothetical protein [Burkholderiaceae bacterium]
MALAPERGKQVVLISTPPWRLPGLLRLANPIGAQKAARRHFATGLKRTQWNGSAHLTIGLPFAAREAHVKTVVCR